ncbi:MAG TPA: nitroreductase family protein [Pseudomonadales bacterium]
MAKPTDATGSHIGEMQAFAGRRSVRAYTADTLSRATVATLLEAAVQAPTAMHAEPWTFVRDSRIARCCASCPMKPMPRWTQPRVPG